MPGPTRSEIAGTPRLHVRSLSKTFGRNRVLANVELNVGPGEIHGLVGQNGSSKSTLIKVLTGIHAPDAGAAYDVDGHPIRVPVRWPEVSAAGVSVVHQDLGLLNELSVAENICVGGYPKRRCPPRIDRGKRDRIAADTLERLGCDISPSRLVGGLSATERAEVAIARAMRDHARGAGLVILDESTRSLAGDDLRRVHALLHRLADEGSSALLVSHNLTEILEVTDRVTVLRDGAVSGAALDARTLSEEEIARRMLGGTLEQTRALTGSRSGPSLSIGAESDADAVTVKGLSSAQVPGLSFAVRAGEVLGLTGLPGSGYEEIPYLVCGAKRAASGTLTTPAASVALPKADVVTCLRAGLVLVPERRDRDGLALDLPVRDNITLPLLARRGRWWLVARRWQHDEATSATRVFDIRPRTPSLLVKQLSGGNQQKVLLAKWMGMKPSVLVAHEPTQAVDIGARSDILTAIRQAADDGMAVLLVSAEPEDLSQVCDRVIVYSSDGSIEECAYPTPEALIARTYGTEQSSSALAELVERNA